MAWGDDRRCPTCGSGDHRHITVITLNTTSHQSVAKAVFACTACGTMYDPQFIRKIGLIGRLIRWLSR